MATITISLPNADLPTVNDVLKLPFGSYILVDETDNQLLNSTGVTSQHPPNTTLDPTRYHNNTGMTSP